MHFVVFMYLKNNRKQSIHRLKQGEEKILLFAPATGLCHAGVRKKNGIAYK